jgi:DNA-directed RNA polymerase specialized sigma24 family protein
VADAKSRLPSVRQAAFKVLFEGLRREVLSVALHITGNRSLAEDMVQETLPSVHQAMASFRGENRVTTWVCRIALSASWRVRGYTELRVEPVVDAFNA